MPRKTRRRISETRRSRRIRRRGTRRSGTRISGGNRRDHNGGNIPFLERIQNSLSEVARNPGVMAARQKLLNKLGMTTPP